MSKQQAPTRNEQITLEQRVGGILGAIIGRRDEIKAVLPPDLPFERYHATINQALRNDPKILLCTTTSIINACIKAAYDGLRLDGREAALVAHDVNVGTKQQPRWEKHAEYFPMVRGLIKKILIGGKVLSMEVETIHERDTYRVVRGTDPRIEHEPYLAGDRGKIVAAYSIALLAGGQRTVEVMTSDGLAAVRAAAKTTYVWDKWPGEMAKKSVIRRHEKRLPSGRDFIDIEARELFPQFQPQPTQQALPPAQRPTRDQFRALSHEPNSAGTPLELGDVRERETVAAGSQERAQDGEQARRRDVREQPQVELPADVAEWSMWQADVLRKIRDAATADAVNEIHRAERQVIEAASKEVAAEIAAALTDRIADLMAGSAS